MKIVKQDLSLHIVENFLLCFRVIASDLFDDEKFVKEYYRLRNYVASLLSKDIDGDILNLYVVSECEDEK